jgi:hypothetical protein
MAKKMIRPLHFEADYDAALDEIERYFENEPKPGTAEADRFDLLALIIEGRSTRRIQSMRSVTGWRRAATRKPISADCWARANARPIS